MVRVQAQAAEFDAGAAAEEVSRKRLAQVATHPVGVSGKPSQWRRRVTGIAGANGWARERGSSVAARS